MKATITVKMDNAAFSDEPMLELARILRELASELAQVGPYPFDLQLRDINGNTVGAIILG